MKVSSSSFFHFDHFTTINNFRVDTGKFSVADIYQELTVVQEFNAFNHFVETIIRLMYASSVQNIFEITISFLQ